MKQHRVLPFININLPTLEGGASMLREVKSGVAIPTKVSRITTWQCLSNKNAFIVTPIIVYIYIYGVWRSS